MKMKKVTSIILISTMILSVFSLTGCSKESKLDSITVTYVTSPLNVPSIIEKDKGLFAKNMGEFGIDTVEYANLTSGADQTQALASGDIQFLYAVGATSVILSAANGADIKIVSMYSRSPKAFRLFASDNTINSPQDLKGKTIAGPQGTILHELLVSYLATDEMTLSDVNFINTTIPDAMASLEGGSVDCALLAGPAAYNADKSGLHIVTTGEDLIEATIVCATTDEFYKANKDIVDAFLDAQKETLDYIDSNHDAAMQEVADTLDMEVSAVEEMYKYYDFDMTVKDSDINAIKETMEFMYGNDMIESEVDIESLVIR